MNRTIFILVSLAIGSLCYSGEVGPSLSVYVVEESASTGARIVDTPEHRKLGYIPRDPAMRITALKQATAKAVPWKTTDGKGNVLESGMYYRVQLVLIESDTVTIDGLTEASHNRPIALSLGERIFPIDFEPFEDLPFEISARNEQEMLEIEKELKPLCAAAKSFPEQLAEKCLHEMLGTKSVVVDNRFRGPLVMIDVPHGMRGKIRSAQVTLFHNLVDCGSRNAVRVLATFLEDERYIYEPGEDYGSSTIAEDAAGALSGMLRDRPELFSNEPSLSLHPSMNELREWWKANKAAYEQKPPTTPPPK